MSDKLLICTVGLPRSGKSTWSRAYSKQHGIPIVCPDAVRYAIHGQRFVYHAEQYVWATVNAMIRALFIAGHNQVILDATNVTRKRRDVLKSDDYEVAFHHIDTPVELCKFCPLGATGNYPEGAVDPSDDGELRLAIAADRDAGIVRIVFGTPTGWIGLPPDMAIPFANSIIAKARELA